MLYSNMEVKDSVKNRIPKKDLTHMSLFTGGGGMDLGIEGGFEILSCHITKRNSRWILAQKNKKFVLRPTRFKTVFANDINTRAKQLYTNFFKRGEDFYKIGSLVNLITRHQNGSDIFPKNVDILTGGFPCQDFSTMGKMQGLESQFGHREQTFDGNSERSRGSLYLWMKRAVEIVRPKIFIAENVKGLSYNKQALKKIVQDFRDIGNGYFVFPPRVLQFANFGLAQSRSRIIFICINKDFFNKDVLKVFESGKFPSAICPYPKSTHAKEKHISRCPWVTGLKAFAGLVEPEGAPTIDQQTLCGKSPYSPKHIYTTLEMRPDNVAYAILKRPYFRRLSEEHGGKLKHELARGLKERRLTIREAARLQSFPDNYKFIQKGISAESAISVIGNAVPPLFAYHLAMRLQFLWPLYFSEEN